MRIFLSVLLALPALAQPWSGVVDPTRAISWNNAGAGTLPTGRTQCGSTIAAYTGTAATINTAITGCGANQYVQLGSGTFNLSTGIRMGTSNVTLRGNGGDATFLVFTGADTCGGQPASTICIWNGDGQYNGAPGNTANWTAGYARGSTTITLSSHTNLAVGSILMLDQYNDTYAISSAACIGGTVVATIGTNTFSTSNGKPIATVQGVNPSGYNSPTGGGYYPVTSISGTTVSYNLGGACPGSYVSGGTITLDDGALTISNDGTFSSFHAQGNNPGRPGNSCGPGGYQCRSSTQANVVASCGGASTFGTACTSNTIVLTSPIYDPHIRSDRSPGAWWGTTLPVTAVGVENLSIDSSGAGTCMSGGLFTNVVSFANASYSWAKGLRTMFACSTHYLLIQSAHNTIRDGYMYANLGHGITSSQSYATDTYTASSDNLVENNIYQHVAVAMQNEGGMGNVYGYNFSIDNDNGASGGTYSLTDGNIHATGTMYNLWEGNDILNVHQDDFHGNAYSMTYFRNYLRGWEPGKTGNGQTYTVNIQTGGRQSNVVGNVLGTSTFHNKYTWIYGTDSGVNEYGCSASIFVSGFGGNCDSRIATGNCDSNTCEIDDVRVNPPNAANPGTTMLWGNYDTVNAAVRFVNAEVPSGLPIYSNAVPSSHILASSWYGANYSAFWTTPWGTPAYPPIGPDVTSGNISNVGGFANKIPARLCFENSGDSSVGPTYTITAASWSAGVATITIGSAAANLDLGTVIIIAGVTPSGYNCPQTPNYCQISASTGTTISYLVASNPGTYSSGGTSTIVVLSFSASNCYSSSVSNLPTVTTTTATSITTTTASTGGNVTSDGGSPVTARGVCYATTALPTTPCTSDGTGTGVFTSSLTSLTPATTYHYRAYATNVNGTAYGADLTIITAGLSPTSLTYTQRSNGEPPYFQDFTVAGVGSITVGSCVNVTGTLCSSIQTSVVTAGVVHVFWDGYTNFNFSAGTYQATMTLTRATGICSAGCTATVNMTIVALTTPTFKALSGPTGCSTSGSPYLDTELCQPTNMRPGGTFNMPTTVGATVTDPNFGGTIMRLSNPANQTAVCADSVTAQWNSDHTITCIQDLTNGNVYFVNSVTGAIRYTNPPNRSMSWSVVSNNVYYYMPGGCTCIDKVTLNLGSNTIASDVAIWTWSGSGNSSNCTNGGDGGVSANDTFWSCFTQAAVGTMSPASQVCLINLGTAVQYCKDWSLPASMGCSAAVCNVSSGGDGFLAHPRLVTNFKGASPSGKVWLIVGSYSQGSNELYSLHPGDTALTDEGAQPLHPGASYGNGNPTNAVFKIQPTTLSDCATGFCRYAYHMDTVGVGGHQYLFMPVGPINPSYNQQGFLDPDVAGVSMMEVSVEAGGGMYETFPLAHGTADTHTNCSTTNPVCIIEIDSDVTPAAYQITNVVIGATTTVTATPNYPGANGDILLIGGVGGVTGMTSPTLCTVIALNGANLNCNGLTTSGTYTANTGSFTLNATPANTPHQMELLLYDASQISIKLFTITRIASHRSVLFQTDRIGGGYYGQSHPNMSPDGSIVAFESNGGIPSYYGAFTVNTGYGAISSSGLVISGVSAGPVVLH